jgi:hypothetical protein
MKGLLEIPGPVDLLPVYNKIVSNPLNLNILLEVFQLVRFDPRLGQLLLTSLHQNWSTLNPFEINQATLKTTWPAVMGVLIEMLHIEIDSSIAKDFRAWKNCALANIPKAKNEQFYIGLYAIGGTQMRHQSAAANQIYKKWGYLGIDLFTKNSPKTISKKTLLNKTDRLVILKELLQKKNVITVNEYLQALSSPVSRRIAEQDLSSTAWVKSQGKTRAKIYKRK